MKIKNLSTEVLLGYNTILGNIVQTCVDITNEADRAVQQNLCKPEAFGDLGHRLGAIHQLAKEKYEANQKELDDRFMRDMGMNVGIRKTQALIVEFEKIIHAEEAARYEEGLANYNAALEKTDNDSDKPTIQLNANNDDNPTKDGNQDS